MQPSIIVDSDGVTYNNDGRRGVDPVDSSEQSSRSKSCPDTWIHPPPGPSRVRRSMDGLPHVAETDANRSSVQTPGHSVANTFILYTLGRYPQVTTFGRTASF